MVNIFSIGRPWGDFRQFTLNEISTVKIITIKAGESLSLQYHNHRDEFWKILEGQPEVTIDDKIIQANEGDEFNISKKENHRIKAGDKGVKFLEIASGKFDENDIIRLEDKYGRV